MPVTSERTRALLALHGEVRSQPASDWTGPFPLPPDIEKFYAEIGPLSITIESHGNPYFIPDLAGLWKLQEGYRWATLTNERLDDWEDDWLVVARSGGDPFIYDRSSGAILHSYHGAGVWKVQKIFADSNSMAACLAQIGAIILEAGESYMDDGCNIRSEYQRLALARFQELQGSKAESQVALNILGWGEQE